MTKTPRKKIRMRCSTAGPAGCYCRASRLMSRGRDKEAAYPVCLVDGEPELEAAALYEWQRIMSRQDLFVSIWAGQRPLQPMTELRVPTEYGAGP